MKLYEKIFYSIKHLIPMIGLAGSTVLPASCAKHDVITEIPPFEPSIEKHDVEIEFTNANSTRMLVLDSLQKYVDDQSVGTIYLVPVASWNGYDAKGICNLRKNLLQPCIDMSTKMRGVGDFNFELGAASLVPDDSIWYVQNGWTINKRYQR